MDEPSKPVSLPAGTVLAAIMVVASSFDFVCWVFGYYFDGGATAGVTRYLSLSKLGGTPHDRPETVRVQGTRFRRQRDTIKRGFGIWDVTLFLGLVLCV